MKKLNSHQAMKEAAKGADVRFVSGYLGHIASKFMNEFPTLVQAINETVALDMAHIQSYLGNRSLVLMKNAGLNEAALPFRNMCDSGVNAGVVIVVTDDVVAEMSENRQDSRVYAELGKTLLLEPKSPSHVYSMTKKAFSLSEFFKMPILVRITNVLNDSEFLESINLDGSDYSSVKRAAFNQSQWVLNPMTAAEMSKLHESRYKQICSFVEETSFNEISIKGGKGCIYSQALTPREKSKLVKYDSVASIGTFPAPVNKLRQFIRSVKSFDIIDAGEGSLVNEICKASHDFSINKIIERNYEWKGLKIKKGHTFFNYASLFNLIKERKADIVVGDFGSYTLARGSPIEYALHYGGGIASAVGAKLAGQDKVYALIGDGGFSAGTEGLLEASRKKIKIHIVIIENGGISKRESLNIDLKELAVSAGASYVRKVHIDDLSSKDFDELEAHRGAGVLLVDYTNKKCTVAGYIVEELKSKIKSNT